MEKDNESIKVWDKLAKLYQDKFMDLNLYNDTYNLFLKLIERKNSLDVLEIGCGPGNITKYLLAIIPELKITAIDSSSNMIELAKKNNPSAQFIKMDMREIHRIDNLYDGIIGGFCIPYLSKSDCIQFISNCKNLLRNSGIIYLSFVEGDYDNSGFQVGSSGDKLYFYYHSLKLLQKTLGTNGFAVKHIIYKKYTKSDNTEETHTIIIAKKESKP